MKRSALFSACLALTFLATAVAGAQSVSVYQTTPDLLVALSQQSTLHFAAKAGPVATAPLISRPRHTGSAAAMSSMMSMRATALLAAVGAMARRTPDAIASPPFAVRVKAFIRVILRPVGDASCHLPAPASQTILNTTLVRPKSKA